MLLQQLAPIIIFHSNWQLDDMAFYESFWKLKDYKSYKRFISTAMFLFSFKQVIEGSPYFKNQSSKINLSYYFMRPSIFKFLKNSKSLWKHFFSNTIYIVLQIVYIKRDLLIVYRKWGQEALFKSSLVRTKSTWGLYKQ